MRATPAIRYNRHVDFQAKFNNVGGSTDVFDKAVNPLCKMRVMALTRT